MDGYKKFQFTPLMSFSLILTTSIITAKYGYDYFSTHLWLSCAVISWGIACCCYVLTEADHHSDLFSKKITRLLNLQGFNLYLCIFCIGGFITSHHIDDINAPVHIETYQSLSSIDRTILASRSFRKQLEQELHSYDMEEQDFAVITAMAMGDKSLLDKETKETFSISGTSHILAVSGLHIGIIFQIIVMVLGAKRRSRLTITLAIIAIWAYVIFIGFPPSAIRAATMLSLYSFCLLSLRPDPTLNNLAFAYIIMLFINPFYIFDISFQMSFLAVGFILMLYPILSEVIEPHNKIVRWSWGLLCMSLAAQIGTLPLITYYFGRISCYSLATSFIAIPAASIILHLCVLLLFISPLTHLSLLSIPATWLQHAIARVLITITHLTNEAFKFVSQLPGASIDHIHINLLQLILIYTAILASFFILQKTFHGKKQLDEPMKETSGLPF